MLPSARTEREGEFPDMEKKKQCFLSLRQVVRMAGEQGRGHTHMNTTRTEIFKGESAQQA